MIRLNKSSFGNIIGILIALYLLGAVVSTVRKNYALKAQMDDLHQQITQVEGERDDLKYKIEYYKTESFKEKEARSKLGLQNPGEGVIILPDDPSKTASIAPAPAQPHPKTNLRQWLDFLLGNT